MINFNEIETIAYLGPQASFSEMAKDKFCELNNIKAYPMPMQTIRQVIEYVDKNSVNTLGVLPVENSIEGVVRETIDNLVQTKSDVFKDSPSRCLITSTIFV